MAFDNYGSIENSLLRLAISSERIAIALETLVGNSTVPHIDQASARELTSQLKEQLLARRDGLDIMIDKDGNFRAC